MNRHRLRNIIQAFLATNPPTLQRFREHHTYIRGRKFTHSFSSGDSVRDSNGHNGTVTRIRDGVVWVRLWKMVHEEGKPARWREKAYLPDALSRV